MDLGFRRKLNTVRIFQICSYLLIQAHQLGLFRYQPLLAIPAHRPVFLAIFILEHDFFAILQMLMAIIAVVAVLCFIKVNSALSIGVFHLHQDHFHQRQAQCLRHMVRTIAKEITPDITAGLHLTLPTKVIQQQGKHLVEGRIAVSAQCFQNTGFVFAVFHNQHLRIRLRQCIIPHQLHLRVQPAQVLVQGASMEEIFSLDHRTHCNTGPVAGEEGFHHFAQQYGQGECSTVCPF